MAKLYSSANGLSIGTTAGRLRSANLSVEENFLRLEKSADAMMTLNQTATCA
jgi:hypothetical protein